MFAYIKSSLWMTASIDKHFFAAWKFNQYRLSLSDIDKSEFKVFGKRGKRIGYKNSKEDKKKDDKDQFLSPYFGRQEQEKQKKEIADYGEEMGCGYSVGNERDLIKEM